MITIKQTLPVSLEIKDGKATALVEIQDILEALIPMIKERIPESDVVAQVGLTSNLSALVIEVAPDLEIQQGSQYVM